MKYGLFTKIALIFLVTLILAAGLARIGFLVDERMARRDSVVAEIAAATARDQTMIGPVLVIPYTRIVKTLKPADKEDGRTLEVEKRLTDRRLLLPVELDVQASLSTEPVRRGLYQAVVFSASLAFKGRFADDGEWVKPGPNEQIILGEPRLIIGISDPRGILRAPALTWGEQRVDFLPGAGEERMANGIQARISGLPLQNPWSTEFAFTLDVRGTQSISLAPVGDATRIAVRGGWPHPSFFGQFLPEARTVTPDGFTAAWATTRLAANMEHHLNAYLRNNQGLSGNGLIGVRFVEPADSYVQSDRALKYGLLFIGLSFIAFFLFEVLRRLGDPSVAVRPDGGGADPVLSVAAVAVGAYWLCAGLCGSDRRLRGADQLLPDLRSGEHGLGAGFWGAARRGVRHSLCADQPGGLCSVGRFAHAVRVPGAGDGVDPEGGLVSIE